MLIVNTLAGGVKVVQPSIQKERVSRWRCIPMQINVIRRARIVIIGRPTTWVDVHPTVAVTCRFHIVARFFVVLRPE
jgi:hypothetical protein